MKKKNSSDRIYFDYAASTPLCAEAARAMKPYFFEKFGNPSSLHLAGQEALSALDRARETVAKALGAEFREVIFTASATEANNVVLRGAVKSIESAASPTKQPRIIVSAIEHESVLETARDLMKDGVELVILGVNAEGFIDLEELKEKLNETTILVSIMYGNNEVGTIQSIAEIGRIIREFKKDAVYPLLHTDAVQAFQFLDCNVKNLDVDFMTISGHKIYGPKGVGCLYARDPKIVVPLFSGGGQEFGIRSGTENVPAIVGFAEAVVRVGKQKDESLKKISSLKRLFWDGLLNIYPKAEVNGLLEFDGRKALPHILNVYFPDFSAADLLVKSDRAGLMVSAGSACSTRSGKPSYVIEALGCSRERASRSIRFSFGSPTTDDEIKRALNILKFILSAL